MSKLGTVITGILVICVAAGYLFWTRTHNLQVSAQPSVRSTLSSEAISHEAGRNREADALAATAKNSGVTADAKPALRSGEVLQFVADVAKLTSVANLRLQILDQRSFYGKNAWHLQAVAHTENPLRMVFELDDQFDSYSDASSFSSLQYEMHLNERGQKIESVQRMTTSRSSSASQSAAETHVLPGTRDPLGFMQFLRTVDWPQLRQTSGPVYDGHKSYDVRAAYQGKAADINVPAGKFSTSKIEIRVFDQGAELKDAHFLLYLADNPAHTPVLLEAVMPFATARVALSKMQ